MIRTGAVALSAVALLAAPVAAGASTPKLVKLTVGSAEHKSVTLHKGQTVAVLLDDCDSCGYSWKRIGGPDRSVLALGPVHFTSTRKPGTVGGGGVESFRFTAKKAGKTKVVLGYYAPGAAGTDRAVTVTVTVK